MNSYQQPDPSGHFGIYGGSFVSETLTHAIAQLRDAYAQYQHDPEFRAEFEYELKHFVGRPSPVYHAARTSREQGGAQIYLKREDLNHTGAHKINNVIGQALLARRMGKPRVIAETGAGQHGVATATICARYGLECVVYMGSEDVKRQSPNVYRMNLLGATVVPVESGSKTLKDALNEAMRDWVTNVENTFYIIGTVAGPHPYPMMVRDFQSVIGNECIAQMPEMAGRQPDVVVACVGGGSNAMGIFHPYIPFANTRLVGVEAAGEGLESGKHSASLQRGSPGVLHGNRTYILQDENGQITETHSVSAGLDYPGVGPEHSWLKDLGRAEYVGITDKEALEAFHYLCRTEGIIPALESSHAIAYAMKLARTMKPEESILVNLSGRGDKDIGTVADLAGVDFYDRPSMRGLKVKGGATDGEKA
jgi:tryptophan synthase beta chain